MISILSAIRHKKILVDVLEAKTAYIEDLIISEDTHIQTSKADIAYHLKIKDQELCAELEEGDIVGFYRDDESGETYIQQLRSNNIHTALHAGVISRSHWMEGNKPRDKGKVWKQSLTPYCMERPSQGCFLEVISQFVITVVVSYIRLFTSVSVICRLCH